MMNHILKLLCLTLALLIQNAAFSDQKVSSEPELLLVYWGSGDCKWCTYWESSWSGMEKDLKQSEEFKKITYRIVKNEHLSIAYTDSEFAQDIKWIKARMDSGEEKHPYRPGWSLYVDRKRVAAFNGTKHWKEKHFPELKRLINMYSSN